MKHTRAPHPTDTLVHCSAPAKLILSGEHAVLYGSPALSLAIDLKSHCTVAYQAADWVNANNTHRQQTHNLPHFTLQLTDLKLEQSVTASDWQTRAQAINQRFLDFKNNLLTINVVLKSPFDLVLMCLWAFNQVHQIKTGHWRVCIHSEVPIGRGLGSSAGVIVSLLASLFKAHHTSVSKHELLALAKQVESYQHGSSSGLDPATLIYAGLLKYQMGHPIQTLPNQKHAAWLIDTGTPQSNTGACVQKVKTHHQHNVTLWQDFAHTCSQIEQAWLNNCDLNHNAQTASLKKAIHQNHLLLCKIGVVPDKVQQVITQLNTELNAACKICGAGSILGDQAGMVLCMSDQSPAELCQQYGYSVWPLIPQNQGVHCELD